MIDFNLIGKKYGTISFKYTWKDVVLYALSVGAQAGDLSFIYEHAKGGLKVIPSFSIIMGIGLFLKFFEEMRPDLSRFIQGEQAIKLHRPIPPEGETLIEGGITDIYDKSKGALLVWRMNIMTRKSELLAEAEIGIFYMGEGGFRGDPGPKAEPLKPPKGAKPDFTVSDYIPENHAALYRLNGDINPLHVDPDLPRWEGFPGPFYMVFALTATP
jgi:hypothetical protein